MYQKGVGTKFNQVIRSINLTAQSLLLLSVARVWK